MINKQIQGISPAKGSRLGLGLTAWLLLAWLFISAFALVYVKDLNRRLSRDYQSLQKQYVGLQTEWEKLLLEQGTWTSQARIQKVAKQQLDMHLPAAKEIQTMPRHRPENETQ